MSNSVHFGLKLKEIRESKGMTQDKFAELLEVSQSTVALWESGARVPRANQINKVAEKLGISADDLYDKDFMDALKQIAEWDMGADLKMALKIALNPRLSSDEKGESLTRILVSSEKRLAEGTQAYLSAFDTEEEKLAEPIFLRMQDLLPRINAEGRQALLDYCDYLQFAPKYMRNNEDN